MDGFQVLVIILSVMLAIFLVLAIVLTVVVIRLTGDIKSITGDAKTTVHRIAETARNVSNITDARYVTSFIKKFVTKVKK